MIDSIIATSHHFFVISITLNENAKSSEIINCFAKNSLTKGFNQEFGGNYVHFQAQLPFNLGTETALFLNRGDFIDNRYHYWYDFYLTTVKQDNQTYFFLFYPYIKLGDFIDRCFYENKLKKKILKPMVPETLTYIKNRGTSGLSNIQKEGFNADIIKYSAVVKEIDNANKINIFGDNPLDSKIFELLSGHSLLKMDPSSLKLKCNQQLSDSIEIGFDKFGNARFWLKKKQLDNVMYIIPLAFRFFREIQALQESSYINSYTLLEDE